MFVLLFLGNFGELRVILTKRSSKLRSFPGHISLPGGKADNGLESEWEVARREMEEEIGLSSRDEVLKKDFGIKIEPLAMLPCYLSRTFLAVRPCIGFMSFEKNEKEVTRSLQLSLNPEESSSIFSCPLRDFIYPDLPNYPPRECISRLYDKIKWGGIPWNLRSFTFPYHNVNEATWLTSIKDTSASEDESYSDDSIHPVSHDNFTSLEQGGPPSKKTRLAMWGRTGTGRDSETNEKIYDVWGLTANILHDLALVMYGGSELHSKTVLGEEELIYSLWHFGNQLQGKQRSPEELKLIKSNNIKDFGFSDILPRTEFLRLKELYKS